MNMDFSNLEAPKRELAQEIFSSLTAFEAAHATPHTVDSSQIKSERSRITKQLEALCECSLEQQIEIGSLSNGAWLCTSYRILSEAAEPFVPENKYDKDFIELIKVYRSTSSDDLLEVILQSVLKMKEQNEPAYNSFVEYFARFPLWGTLDPAHRDYDTLRRRAIVLKTHSYDFLWLYRRLSDYLSKRTLTAILLNWTVIDLAELVKIKSIFPDYYEPDIFPNNKNDVFVDIGAYTGDSVLSYVRSYGDGYKKIYAYEISEKSCMSMQRNLADLHDVEIRKKGVGKAAGEFFLNVSVSDQSANQLSDSMNSVGERVEVVALDEDLPDGFTFLKMDIEGAEYDALRGSEQTIRRCHPKLAICVYHGYDDIWRLPALIDRYNPDYKFYLRHNGGNLIPTEFVLLAK